MNTNPPPHAQTQISGHIATSHDSSALCYCDSAGDWRDTNKYMICIRHSGDDDDALLRFVLCVACGHIAQKQEHKTDDDDVSV